MQLTSKQLHVIGTLIDIINYHNTSIDGVLYPEEVFKFFVDKYLHFDEEGYINGYIKASDGTATKNFEQTRFFEHVCAYLRSRDNKTYLIDIELKPVLAVLAISYEFNHFDPRIYSYVGQY
jgi:hypothetical protein